MFVDLVSTAVPVLSIAGARGSWTSEDGFVTEDDASFGALVRVCSCAGRTKAEIKRLKGIWWMPWH